MSIFTPHITLWRYILFIFLSTVTTLALSTEKISLQLKWHHQFQFAGYYAAKAQGYYAKAGLDVTFIEATPEINIVKEITEGRAQFGVGSNSILLAHHSGAPIVVLGVIFQHSPYVLLAKKDDAIQSIHDLVGKRIMLEPHADELIAYLKNEGIPLQEMQQIKHQFSAQPLINNETDTMSAYISDEPFLLDKEGIEYSRFSPRSAGIDFYGDNLFTTQKEISEHPDRVKAFRAASMQGWEYALSHPEEIVDLILKQYPTPKDRQQLLYEADKMRPLILPELIEIGYMLPGRWQHIAETYVSLGMLPNQISLDSFLYDSSPKFNIEEFYWAFGLIFTIITIITAIAWHFSRINKSLNQLLYLRNHQDNIGEAINNISHQWKQPLNSLGFQLMRIEQIISNDKKSNSEVLKITERSQNTLQLMADTVDTFQGFLKTNIKEDFFSPDAIINDTLQILQDNFKTNNIKMETDLNYSLKIFGSTSDLSNVLLNILINARDALAQRETSNPNITLSLTDAGTFCVITITDNAGGITQNPINTIFNLGVSGKKNHKSGIGLYISKKIVVEKMHGEISVSNIKQGTEFKLLIPKSPNLQTSSSILMPNSR